MSSYTSLIYYASYLEQKKLTEIHNHHTPPPVHCDKNVKSPIFHKNIGKFTIKTQFYDDIFFIRKISCTKKKLFRDKNKITCNTQPPPPPPHLFTAKTRDGPLPLPLRDEVVALVEAGPPHPQPPCFGHQGCYPRHQSVRTAGTIFNSLTKVII